MANMPREMRWAIPVFLLIGVVRLFSVYKTWTWRRFGVYLYVGCTLAASLVSLVAGFPVASSLSLAALIGLVIPVLVVRPVWEHFK